MAVQPGQRTQLRIVSIWTTYILVTKTTQVDKPLTFLFSKVAV